MTTEKQPLVFNQEHVKKLEDILLDVSFNYQLKWHEERNQRTRMIIKSRQIGATYYFSLEALLDALITGRNQIFLSPTETQSLIYRDLILYFAAKAGLEIDADQLRFANGATIYFLGEDSENIGALHGNVYFDEFLWVCGFADLNKIAKGMAEHKKYRKTYFSSLSTEINDGYSLFSDEIDKSHSALHSGLLFEDGIWRQVVTAEDAAKENTLLDIEELRREFNPKEFSILYMCKFPEAATLENSILIEANS